MKNAIGFLIVLTFCLCSGQGFAADNADGATRLHEGEVITDLKVVRSESDDVDFAYCEAGWHLLRRSPNRAGIDLNQGGLPVGNNDDDSEPGFYLCYKTALYTEVTRAISLVYISPPGTNSCLLVTDIKIDININEGTGRVIEDYVCYRESNLITEWLTGLMVLSRETKVDAGWELTTASFNSPSRQLRLYNLRLIERNQANWDCGGLNESPCSAGSGFSGGVGVINICDRGLRDVQGQCVNGLAPRARFRPVVTDYLLTAEGVAATWAINNQRDQLQIDEPLNWISQIAAHNAYNNTSDGYVAPNHPFSVSDQLRLGTRMFLMDLHWLGDAVRLAHAGDCCATDRLFTSFVKELADWVDLFPNDTIIVYTEDYVQAPEFDYLINDAIRRYFQDRAYVIGDRGTNGVCDALDSRCDRWPTRREMLKQGKNVIFVNQGANIHGEEFIRSAGLQWPANPEDLPVDDSWNQCVAYERSSNPFYFHRIEDLLGDKLTEQEIYTLANCNWPMASLDDIDTNGRINAIVWSWAPGETGSGSHAFFSFSKVGRWNSSASPQEKYHFACASPVAKEPLLRSEGNQRGYARDQQWAVTRRTGAWSEGEEACKAEFPDLEFKVPVNGWQNQNLMQAYAESGVPLGDRVWLNYFKSGPENWRPNRLQMVFENGFETPD